MKTTNIPLVFALIVSLLAAGCGQQATEQIDEAAPVPAPSTEMKSETPREPEDGDWLIGRLPAEMESLNPYTTSDLYSSQINDLIFETLLDRDNETLELQPLLAESWEISEDKLTYTFHMHENVNFSDGEPLTADDVKFSFDTIKDPKTDAPHAKNYYQDVVACEVIDPYTVRFTCSKPYFRHIVVLGALDILPEHVYGTGDFNTHPNNRKPIGSGPYVLESWETGQRLVLNRNESYWREKPHILKRVYKIITNNDAALQVMLRGELDTMGLRPEQYMTYAERPDFQERFETYAYYRPNYVYIGWNLRKPQFSDNRVRQALTMLLDRELILEEIFYGMAKITTGNFFVDEPEYNDAIEPWPFNPERAKALLAEAGWTDSDQDGLLDKNGEAFRFEILLSNDSVSAEQIATFFQQELKRAGIEMTIRQLEWATYLDSVKQHRFDSCMLGWSLVPDPDPYQIWHSSQTVKNGSNAVGFKNEEADSILEEARTVFDRGKRVEMYHRFHEILHEEQPYTFLYCTQALVPVDRRFQNVKVYPYGLDSIEWWVPSNLQRYP